MSNENKPKLLFLRFTQPNIPSFLKRHLQEHVRCLSQRFDVTVVEDQTCDYDQLCDRHEPDLAMFESGSYVGKRNVSNVHSHPSIPKVGFLSCDAYCPTRIKAIADMARWEISTFFGNSVSLPSYTPSIADQFFAWPNFVIPEVHRDYGFPKVIPVLFSGSQAANYPWRNRIDRIVSQRYPALHCPHFGFQWQKGKPSAASFLEGEKYAQLINSAWVAPTCGTIANEVVRKHFEIPACNTCLLTERTAALESAGFVDLVNCVFADEGDVLDKLEWLFQNPEELQRIIGAGKQLVDARHTIHQRDQVFQWYALHKQLQPGQKIVQPSPFAPLTIVEESSGVTNGHPASGGLDRQLIRQGDEQLKIGKFDEAERLYQRCLNYQPNMPEAKLRLCICWLHEGDSRTALAAFREQFPSHRLVNDKELEPDPTEWAWFVIALLCCGKNREAALRAGQFSSLQNEELVRVRFLIAMLQGQSNKFCDHENHQGYRASVHPMPRLTVDEWLANIGLLLKACGQIETANKLARVRSSVSSLEVRSSAAKQHGFGQDALKYYLAAGSRITRFAQSTTSRLRQLGKRFGGRVPDGLSRKLEEDRAAIVGLLQKEDLHSGAFVGSENNSWLSEAFLLGMRGNPNMPSIDCVNGDLSDFTSLMENSDIIAIDCGAISKNVLLTDVRASLVILGNIDSRAGSELFRAMSADENYSLVVHEPDRGDGYAAFRRIVGPNSVASVRRSHVAATAESERDPIVVLASDEKFAMPLAATVRSAIENLAPDARLRLYILDGGIEESTKQRLIRSWPAGRFEISWIRVDGSSLGCPVTMKGSVSCYFRMLIPRLLPSEIRRAIYLDSDLLIRGDLTQLWSQASLNWNGNVCLAVQDVGAPFIDSSQAIANYQACAPYIYYSQPIPNFRELELDPRAPYFNSGVLMIDLDAWRRDDISGQLIECLANNAEHVHLWDQYALNVVLANRWGSLDRRWNQGLHIYQFPSWELSPYDRKTFEQQRDDPFIVHYTTSHKPWRASCRHPLRQDFLDCIQRTDWAGWRIPRFEVVAEVMKTQERRFRRGRRWLRDQAWKVLSGDRERRAA